METKKEEGKTVSMNGQAENAAAAQTPATPEPVYKIVPETYNKLGAYLLTRPIREVKVLYAAFFRHGQKDPFYKQHAINALVDYLTQCPMGEVEALLEELEKGGLQQYMPEANPAGEKKEGEAPAAQ